MKYKRLTTKDEEGNWQVWEDDYSHPFEALQVAIDRLAELEDKIEKGDLVSIKSVSKFIEMAFASEPPCSYEIDGDYCIDVIETNTKEWCETHCDVKDVYTECWEQYLRAKLKELQKNEND